MLLASAAEQAAAQAAEQASLGSWLMNCGLVLVFLMQVFQFMRAKGAQKREVSFSAEYATRDEFNHLQSTVDDMEDSMDELSAELKKDASELHEKINRVAISSSKQEGQLELINQNVVGLGNKLDRFIQETRRS